jgi:hypothetical protein
LGRINARQLGQEPDGLEPHAGMVVLDQAFSKSGPLSNLRCVERIELAGFDPSDLVSDLVGICCAKPSIGRLEEGLLERGIKVT